MKFREFLESVKETVYHGTRSQFNQFDLAYTRGQLGFHFGTYEQAKNIISKDEIPEPGSRIIAAKITIKNPLHLPDTGSWYGFQFVDIVNQKLKTNLNPSAHDSAIRKSIIQNGYDGVVYENIIEGDGPSYIVFNPSQIQILNIEQY